MSTIASRPIQSGVTRRGLARLGASLGLFALARPALAAEWDDMVLESTVMVPMRDGIRLATDIYRPARGGKPIDGAFPVLLERKQQLAGTLSGGQQQMLAIGRALMAAPRMLLADELSLGLAPIIVRQVFAKLDEVRRTGVTVIVVEQNARLAMKFADYLYVLKYGRVVMEGRREIFERSTDLVDAYLGA